MAAVDMVDVTDGIATIEMHGPKANAMNDAFLADLQAAFQAAERHEAVRGVLLTGRDRFFSAGLDLGALTAGQPPARFNQAMETVFTFPKPVAAAVNGHAIAGGCVLMLAADYAVLADGDFRVGLTELDVGVPFPRIAFEIVRFALPPQNVPRVLYGAELMSPSDAFGWGMAQELVAPEELLDAARAWLAPVAARPLPVFALTKRWLRAEAMARVRARPDEDREETAAATGSEEARRRIREAAARLGR